MVSAHASGNESSDEEAVIGNSWQRSELTGVNDQSPAEKLGQLVAGLYILLVATT